MNPTHQQLADLLRQARQMLNDAYLQDQTSAYSRWKVECDAAWLAKGIMLPYSSNVAFPSEKEVIAKALELYNSQNPQPVTPLVQPATNLEPIAEPIAQTPAPEIAESIPVEEPISATEEEVAEVAAPVIEPTAEIAAVDDAPTEDSEEGQRTSRLRSLLNKFMATATDLETKNTKGNPNDV